MRRRSRHSSGLAAVLSRSSLEGSDWAEAGRGGERGLDSGQTPHIIQDTSGRQKNSRQGKSLAGSFVEMGTIR